MPFQKMADDTPGILEHFEILAYLTQPPVDKI